MFFEFIGACAAGAAARHFVDEHRKANIELAVSEFEKMLDRKKFVIRADYKFEQDENQDTDAPDALNNITMNESSIKPNEDMKEQQEFNENSIGYEIIGYIAIISALVGFVYWIFN